MQGDPRGRWNVFFRYGSEAVSIEYGIGLEGCVTPSGECGVGFEPEPVEEVEPFRVGSNETERWDMGRAG